MSQKPFEIILADLRHYNKLTEHDLYVPLNVGYLSSHLTTKYKNDVSISLYLEPKQFLKAVSKNRVQLIGLSFFEWNTGINKFVIKYIREKISDRIPIVIGGPSIDADVGIEKEEDQYELNRLFDQLDGIDAIIQGEGEIPLSNLVGELMAGEDIQVCDPIDGVVMRREGKLVAGNVPDAINLDELESPILSGILDDFLKPPFKPMLSSSRGCPFKCKYCVMGIDNNKIRSFPIAVTKKEMTYIASKYAKWPHLETFIIDDNFGIFKQDVEIAEHIAHTFQQLGYPALIYYYVNKSPTPSTRKVATILRDQQNHYCMSLQTDNKESLEAVGRRNMSDEKLKDTIEWIKSNELEPMTELIYPLPFETKESFHLLLEKCVEYGFRRVAISVLQLLDGAILNRRDIRKLYGFKTRHRLFMANYGIIDGEDTFTCESEEVVVSTDTFSFDDFMDIRCASFMFYAVYMLSFQYPFFQELKLSQIKILDFIDAFFNPNIKFTWPEKYLSFLSDFKKSINDELFESEDDLYNQVREQYLINNCKTLAPTKINFSYAIRLIYEEKDWIPDVFINILNQLTSNGHVHQNNFKALIDFYYTGLIDKSTDVNNPPNFDVKYDLKSWMNSQMIEPINKYKLDHPTTQNFFIPSDLKKQISSFNQQNEHLNGYDYHYALMQSIKVHNLFWQIA